MIRKSAAERLLGKIKRAKRILLAVHVSPDPDGICSVLAMNLVLRRLGKKTKIISFGPIPPKLQFLSGVERIEVADFTKIDFNEFGLFIALDCGQERMITRSPFPEKFPENFRIVNIDHHVTNTKFGDINLVEVSSSTAELLYKLFGLWKVKIDKKIAVLLFYGIFADTGCFQYPLTTAQTFKIASDLTEKGATLSEAVLHDFRSYSFKTLKYWGKILENMRMDESGKFIWSKLSKTERGELGVDPTDVEGASTLFAPIVSGTEFGIIITEETDGLIRGSLRSRADFDVSKIAVELGGGGHRQAAGFSLKMPLDEAEKKVLEIARKYIS